MMYDDGLQAYSNEGFQGIKLVRLFWKRPCIYGLYRKGLYTLIF